MTREDNLVHPFIVSATENPARRPPRTRPFGVKKCFCVEKRFGVRRNRLTKRLAAIGLLLLVTVMVIGTGCQERPGAGDRAERLSADQVIDRMVATYQKTETYQDRGKVRLEYRRGGRLYQDESPLMVIYARPGRAVVKAYQAQVVSDGTKIHARIKDASTNDFDQQVVVRPAPNELDWQSLLDGDPVLQVALRQGRVGLPVQLDLLLSDDPLAALRDEASRSRLLESESVDGQRCHRVEIETPDGRFVLWIEERRHCLRRIEYPTSTFAPEILGDPAVERVRLTAEFEAVQLGHSIAPDVFQCSLEPTAKVVKQLIPPPQSLPSDLFGKTVSDFAFEGLDGNALTSKELGQTIKVLVWFNNHPACQSTMRQLDQVARQFRDERRLTVLGVCVEPESVTTEQIRQLARRWDLQIRLVRDLRAVGRDRFHVPWAPTLVAVNDSNVVQLVEVGANPDLRAQLPQVIERLLEGDDLATEILAERDRRAAEYAAALRNGRPAAQAKTQEEHTVVPFSRPSLFRLRKLWTNDQLTAPGNITLLNDRSAGPRLLVNDGWRTITELSAAGKLVDRHVLNLPRNAAITQLRTDCDARGRRRWIAWSLRGRQVHLLDDQWNVRLSYPDISTEHDGIQDACLIDANQDDQLDVVVGFWGNLGVHCVTPLRDVLWTNRRTSHVATLNVLPLGERPSELLVSSASGQIQRLDRNGQNQPVVQPTHPFVTQLYRSAPSADGPIRWCGISNATRQGRVAVGFTGLLDKQWQYPLSGQAFDRQVRFVTSAILLDDQHPYWIFATPDHRLHIVSHDGQVHDSFHPGNPICGFAAGRHGDQGFLAVASPTGVQAWAVSPPATADLGSKKH